MEEISHIQKIAHHLRKKSLKMAFDAGKNGAHLGGGLSLIEVFATLYGKIANINQKSPDDENRDRIIISKGHCVLSYYSILNYLGFLDDLEIEKFETNNSFLHGHATRDLKRGIEFSGGSLGLGMSFAIGVALAGKLKGRNYHNYVIVGDGECNEGIVWEALMSASHFQLDNLTVIVDNNRLQYDGYSCDIMNMGNLKSKFEAFGFFAVEVDGHDIGQLLLAFEEKISKMPKVIIANTVKGKGVSFMENKREWHHAVITAEQYNKAISEL